MRVYLLIFSWIHSWITVKSIVPLVLVSTCELRNSSHVHSQVNDNSATIYCLSNTISVTLNRNRTNSKV